VIHICIPVHNEAETIGILLWKIRKVMAEFGRDYEIAVLDDASTDATPQVLDRYRRVLPLVVERSETRLGYGAATERLLRRAVETSRYPRRDVAVTIQGDFTESPDDLVPMVKAIEGGSDLVVASLDARRTELPRSLRLGRWLGRTLVGRGPRRLSVSDPLSGLRAYRLVVLRKALREEDGASTDAGVAASLAPLGATAAGGAGAAGCGWAANVALLARTAPHARRIDETTYALRLHPRTRATRFRLVDELRGLLPLRRVPWPAPPAEAA
jgi:hypothetical protein